MNIELSPRQSPSTSRALGAARVGLTIAALALAAGCTADDLTEELNGARLAKAASTQNAAPQCAGDTSPHTLFLKDPQGNEFQLVHCRGSGWKYVAADKPSLRKIGFSPVAKAQAGTTSLPAEEPMAVFVDGPTGYAFAWTSEQGWKFVGNVTDESR